MILKKTHGNRKIKVLTAGLGNRYATPDMLGNKVIEYIDIIPEKFVPLHREFWLRQEWRHVTLLKNSFQKADLIIFWL